MLHLFKLLDTLQGHPHIERITTVQSGGDQSMNDCEQNLPIQEGAGVQPKAVQKPSQYNCHLIFQKELSLGSRSYCTLGLSETMLPNPAQHQNWQDPKFKATQSCQLNPIVPHLDPSSLQEFRSQDCLICQGQRYTVVVTSVLMIPHTYPMVMNVLPQWLYVDMKQEN